MVTDQSTSFMDVTETKDRKVAKPQGLQEIRFKDTYDGMDFVNCFFFFYFQKLFYYTIQKVTITRYERL